MKSKVEPRSKVGSKRMAGLIWKVEATRKVEPKRMVGSRRMVGGRPTAASKGKVLGKDFA